MSTESATDDRQVVVRLFNFAVERYRPPLGWAVLATGLLLALLPSLAIREAKWIDLRRVQVILEWVTVISLLSGWWLVSLLRDWTAHARPGTVNRRERAQSAASSNPQERLLDLGRYLGFLLCFLLWIGLGLITITQVLVHWIPGPLDLWRAAKANDWLALTAGVEADVSSLIWRYTDWVQGVQAGGAYQDDFVFLSFSEPFCGCWGALQRCLSSLPATA